MGILSLDDVLQALASEFRGIDRLRSGNRRKASPRSRAFRDGSAFIGIPLIRKRIGTRNHEFTTSKPPVRPTRYHAPTLVILRLRTDLQPNAHHPLAALDPERRGEQREQLIGSILARLANEPSADIVQLDTMTEAARNGERANQTRCCDAGERQEEKGRT